MSFPQLSIGEPLEYPTGVHFDMDRATYDRIPYFSQTVLKRWLEYRRNPGRFIEWLASRGSEEKSKGMLKGSVLDCLILEPACFTEKFVVLPRDTNLRTKAGRELRDALISMNPTKQLVSAEIVETAEGMRRAVLQDPDALEIIENSRKAVIITDLYGFRVKMEVDLFEGISSHLSDIKGMESTDSADFSRDAIEYGYDKQWTFYLEGAKAVGVEKDTFNFVTVQNHDPFKVEIHSIKPDTIDQHAVLTNAARHELSRSMIELADRFERDDFPTLRNYVPLQFPGWAVSRARRTLEEAA